ncbi:MAG: hypothetical protein GF317_10975 [Candidatus Lokiarchaeota archaeon]|nr:hypothetical protein [Candidatus Lokiarchaeota archaeon]MBD3200185.1 hypothetical protein [Candidatus Lokiarchaeota archaeon]
MSELNQNRQVCRFCQQNTKLAYYCENCSSSCCSDCLDDEKVDSLICQDCNSKNIETSESEDKRVCGDCGNENIIKITQHIASCPNCHSHQIVNIYEKKEKLEQEFLELIKDSRLFLKPFRELINQFYVLREKIKKARDPPICCYHFPKMESELISLFKLIKYLEDNLLERISKYFHHLDSNKEHFFDIYSQPNSSVRIFEGILSNLHRTHDSIEGFVEKNLANIKKNIESIEKNLAFIEKITNLFSEYKRFINLAEDEKPVYAINAKLSNSPDNQEILKRTKGYLFITNVDLSFVHQYGLIKTKQELIFKAPVDDIVRIKEKGKIFKKLYIEFPYGKYEFSLTNKAIERIIEYILLARNFDETTIYDERASKKLNNITIDLNRIKNFIEDGINSFFSLKCKINSENKSKNNEQEPPVQYPSNGSNYPQNYPHNQQKHIPPNYNPNPSQNQTTHYPYNNPNANSYREGHPSYNERYNQNYENSNYPSIQHPTPHPNNSYIKHNTNNHPPRPYPNYPRSEFYWQNPYNPNKIQNYNPQNYPSHLNTQNSQNGQVNNNIYDMEQKNQLMKKLEQAYKSGQNIPPNLKAVIEDINNVNSLKKTSDSLFNDPIKSPLFQEFNKNHLSDFFRSENNMMDLVNQSEVPKNIDQNQSHLIELKRERFSILQTLKNLEKKFDQGKISEVDYIRAFRNLQKEIFPIDKKIQDLKRKIKKKESLERVGRDFGTNRYFS